MWIDEVPAKGPTGPQIPIGETKVTALCWLHRRELNQQRVPEKTATKSTDDRQYSLGSIYELWELSINEK